MHKNKYSVDQIKLLSDVQHIKTRKGMYIGEALDPRQLLSEIIDNAVDEVQSDTATRISIRVDTLENRYTVIDDGRGIPIGVKNTKVGDLEVVEALTTISNSGGKFDKSSYIRSCGTHGVGLTVTNALSSNMELTTNRDGRFARIVLSNGEKVSLVYGKSNISGTTVTFVPNPEYFESSIIPLQFIYDRVRTLRAFGYNVEYIVDEEPQDVRTASLKDLLPSSEMTYAETQISYQSSTKEEILVYASYTSGTTPNVVGFTNLLYNKYGGTHTRLILKAVQDAWQPFYSEVSTHLHTEDCTVGLNILVAVFLSEIEFSSQTKDKLTVPKSNLSELMSGFKKKFTKYLTENPELRKGLLKRFEQYRISQNKLRNQKEILDLVKISDSSLEVVRKSDVPGLITCSQKKKSGTEIIFVEGNSAGGAVARARNPRTQSVLGTRGKIKNVSQLTVKEALGHESIRNMINAIGAGVTPFDDPDKCKYEKVIFLADSDPDGLHINILNIAVPIFLTPNLVKAGMIYVVTPPLYGFTVKGKRYFCNDLSEIPKNSTEFSRYKGLGEMDDEELRDTCLQDQREIFRVEYPEDIDEFSRIVGTSEGRSELLENLGILRKVGFIDASD